MDNESNNINNQNRQSSIKTYRDIAIEMMKDNPNSLAKMVLKEKQKDRIKSLDSIKNPKNLTLTIISVVLSILGILALVAILIFFNYQKNEISNGKYDKPLFGLVNYDYKKVVLVEDKDDIIDSVDKIFKDVLEIPYGEIKSIFFIRNNGGNKEQITSKEFLGPKFLDVRAPNQFIYRLDDRFTYGLLSILSKTRAFLLLKTKNIEISTASMYAWERTMLYDIGFLFNINRKYYSMKYKSVTLYNHDVRAVYDEEGDLVFGYSFIGNNRILLFTDAKVLDIILKSDKNFIKK